ncbi:hypothetical protein IMAU30049_00625 [Lactobacillus helveticus]|nr:hypothetical protein [Lactobacillus helveticus]NRO68033.1 hypothetical protein [Lactobacillus helveticus]
MYKSYVYDGNGKRTGEVYKAYVSITCYGGKTKLSNGKSAVKIGDNKYIMASNILGNSRTFKADADVYQSNGSLSKDRLLRHMGQSITLTMKLTIESVKMHM